MESETESKPVHVFLVSFPGHGHSKPMLRLGKRLASKGLLVTFSTTESFGEEMGKAYGITTDRPTAVGDGAIRFEFFEDKDEDEDEERDRLSQMEAVGRKAVPRMIKRQAEQGRPVACLVNNPFLPWISDVAGDLGIPVALLWVHSCSCFSAYYHHYHGLLPFPTEAERQIDVQLPFMPLLKYDEIGTFLLPSAPPPLRKIMMDQFKNLEKYYFCTLMDTFHELEPQVIDYISKICPIKCVGPLLLNSPNPNTNTKLQNDVVPDDDDCVEWLDSKPPSSVVYISFGTVVSLNQEQIHEIAHGLLKSGVYFLWVMKQPKNGAGSEVQILPEGFLEKAGGRGKMVGWCPQERVLAHPSVACTVSHCGWNSSMEALVAGVPVVAFPQWGDQLINAKFLVDEFEIGARLCRGVTENKLITREEVEKCLMECTTGPKGAKIKENSMKWKKAAELAVTDGGSSESNLQRFVDELRGKSG